MTEKPKNDLPNCHARFKARYLNALRGLLNAAREVAFSQPSAGLFIEPAAKGCFLIASTGKTMGVIHDADGFANKPFRALLPKEFCWRCAPPAPVQMFLEGPYELPLPEWAQPGDVDIFPVCALLMPQMDHPSVEDKGYAPALANARIETSNHWREDDFRLFEGATLPWRKIFDRESGARDTLNIDPRYVALFQSLEEVDPNGYAWGFQMDFPARDDQAVIIRAREMPEFIGAVMPQKACEYPPLPDWIAIEPKAEEEADAQ